MGDLKLPDIVVELKRGFSFLNDRLFDSKLSLPSIIVQEEKKVVFRFVPESYHMIVGSGFADVDYQEMCKSFLHEMVHVRNHSEGVVDCTSNQYHNKKFLSAALDVGFYVGRHKTQGWGITSFDYEDGFERPKADVLIRRENAFADFSIDKQVFEQTKAEMRNRLDANNMRKVCFLKYVCGCSPPHNSIRSGRRPDGEHPLKIMCLDCKREFRLADDQ